MSIDLARELTVRCIAHNIARHYGSSTLSNDDETRLDTVADYAMRLAVAINPANAPRLAEAATALWRATGEPAPIDTTMHGLQPEEDPARD